VTVLDRLVGVEQEYAILAQLPSSGSARPDHRDVFVDLVEAVGRRVTARPAGGLWGASRERWFTQTGGSIYYEALVAAPDAGLVEAATPECRGPAEALRYARASDRLLADAARAVGRARGGRVVLRKNGRDGHGHVYGPQENYDTELASGASLVGWRAGLVVLLPLAAVAGVVHLVTNLVAIAVATAVALGVMTALAPLDLVRVVLGRPRAFAPGPAIGRSVERLARLETFWFAVLFGPLMLLLSLLLRAFAWRPYRRGANGFLVTRMIFSGAGTVEPDGSWALSEKASAIRRELRWAFASGDRGLIETGHLLKALHGTMLLRPRDLASLWRPRQRLQIGLGDANPCEVAEYLKLATTALVLDLVEAGELADAPRPVDPAEAARSVSRGGLHAPVCLVGGRTLTALEIQRFYQERAAAWVAAHPAPSLEAHALVRRWGEVLVLLERDPVSLVGRLDHVTKRVMIDTGGEELDVVTRKAIDLRYHDLDEGWLARLDSAGLVEHVVSADEVARAIVEPPTDTPAALRGAVVRGLAPDEPATIDWSRARVGGRVIPFVPRPRDR
jgi:proteasome accessory factor A